MFRLTAGIRSSEFRLFVANVVGQLVLALNGNETGQTATKWSLAGAVAYIISRGLAKTETRGPGGGA